MSPLTEKAGRAFAILLLVVHAGLGLWALTGLLELALPRVPWPRLSNPLFSRAMLLTQWTLIAAAALVFPTGYARRWKRLPYAMLAVYGAMALVCAWQTFFILTHNSRFWDMGLEYLEYAAILAFLFFSKHARERLGS